MSDIEKDPQAILDESAGLPSPSGPPPVPANSPLSAELREAIVWARYNGVVEMELNGIGRFLIRPSAAPLPFNGQEALADKYGKKAKLAPGGYDEATLYAATTPTPTPEE
jgi:hypothetical protein